MTKETGSNKRVKNLKRFIIAVVILLVLTPSILCLLLAVQVSELTQKYTQMQKDMSVYQEQVGLQLEELTDSLAAMEYSQTQEISLGTQEAVPETDAQTTEELSTEVITEIENQLVWDNVSGGVEPWDSATGIRRVYLTFDDGPSIYTDQILDVLDAYGVKATFFVVGKEGYTEQYQRIVEEGHSLGMHSYSHKYQEIYSSLEAYQQDLYKLHDYLYELTGVDCKIARFPGGSSNKKTSRVNMRELIGYLGEVGIQYYDWNVSSGDAASVPVSAEQIAENVLDNIGRYNSVIVLMHDAPGKKTTLEALPTIIESILQSDNTVLLPITEDTIPIQHVKAQEE